MNLGSSKAIVSALVASDDDWHSCLSVDEAWMMGVALSTGSVVVVRVRCCLLKLILIFDLDLHDVCLGMLMVLMKRRLILTIRLLVDVGLRCLHSIVVVWLLLHVRVSHLRSWVVHV
jgi:hypothetical protein